MGPYPISVISLPEMSYSNSENEKRLDWACNRFRMIMPSNEADEQWVSLRSALAEPGCQLIDSLREFFKREAKLVRVPTVESTNRLDEYLCSLLIRDIRRLPYVWTACQDFHLDVMRKSAGRVLSTDAATATWHSLCQKAADSLASLESAFAAKDTPWPGPLVVIADLERARRNIFSVTSSSLHRFIKKHLPLQPKEVQDAVLLPSYELIERITVLPIVLLQKVLASSRGSRTVKESLQAFAKERAIFPACEPQEHALGLLAFSSALLECSYLRTAPGLALNEFANGVDCLDLIQEVLMGVIEGARRFDYRKDKRALHQCTTWGWQKVRRFVADTSRTVRVPVHVQDRNKSDDLALITDPVPLHIGAREDHPLDFPETDERAPLFIPPLRDLLYVRPHVKMKIASMLLKEYVLMQLTEREQEVLTLRFGLDDEPEQTLEQVGERFARTRERIRQIESKALERLRKLLKKEREDLFIEWCEYGCIDESGLMHCVRSRLRTALSSSAIECPVSHSVGVTALMRQLVESLPSWRGHGRRRRTLSRGQQLEFVMSRLNEAAHYTVIHSAMLNAFPSDTPMLRHLYSYLYNHPEKFTNHGQGNFVLRAATTSENLTQDVGHNERIFEDNLSRRLRRIARLGPDGKESCDEQGLDESSEGAEAPRKSPASLERSAVDINHLVANLFGLEEKS